MGTFLVFIKKLLSFSGVWIKEDESKEPLKDRRKLQSDNLLELTREPETSSCYDHRRSNSVTSLRINANEVSANSGHQLGSTENGCIKVDSESFPKLSRSQKKQKIAKKKIHEGVVAGDGFSNRELKCPQNGKTQPDSRSVKSKKKASKRKRKIQGYHSTHKILLVGEGNFSFSACLAKAFRSATNMVATSLNCEEYLKCYYKDAMDNVSELKRRGCKVLHDVDATTLANHSSIKGQLFDRIIYNFPHCGDFSPTKQARRKNRSLVRLFMENSSKMIEQNGEIHIRHKTSNSFAQWDLKGLASETGLVLIEEAPVHICRFEGYETKYGFERGKISSDDNFDCYPCLTYKFALPGHLKSKANA